MFTNLNSSEIHDIIAVLYSRHFGVQFDICLIYILENVYIYMGTV